MTILYVLWGQTNKTNFRNELVALRQN